MTLRVFPVWLASPPPPGGPAGRYLVNPGGTTAHLAHLALAALAQYGPATGP